MIQSPLTVATATLKLYAECARAALVGLYRNWIILVTSLVLALAFKFLATALSAAGSSLVTGFIIGLLGVCCIAIYYAWVSSTVQGEKIEREDLVRIDGGLFSQVMSVAFILWIATTLLNAFIVTPNIQWISLCIDLGLVIVLNAIPEILYLQRHEGLSAIQEAFAFVRDNWIEWFIPFLIVTTPVLFNDPLQILVGLTAGSVFLPPWTLVQASGGSLVSGGGLIALIITLVIAHWFMLFRGHLFLALSSGSRRQRAFRERVR